jgi:hypothetical protein
MVKSEPPPDGLSVWATHEDHDAAAPDTARRIPLPTVVADDRTIRFQVIRSAVRFFGVTLAYHPGWGIAHPLEAEGRAVRLWPSPGRSVDFADFPPVPTRETVWAVGPTLHFSPGAYGVYEFRHLGADWNPLFEHLPGVAFAAAPALADPDP